MELQTYDECIANKHLFKTWDDGDGRFVREFVGGGGFSFRWFEDDEYHRIDGPAYISIGRCNWWFMGELVYVDSQEEFEKWLMDKF